MPDVRPAGVRVRARGRQSRALHAARPVARILQRHGRHRARAGGRSRIRLLADPAAALGIRMGRSRRKRGAAFRDSPRRSREATDLWQWLALAGGAGLLAEWILYGRFRRRVARVAAAAGRHAEGIVIRMTFAHPWLVPLALAPLAWAAWEWRNSARRAGSGAESRGAGGHPAGARRAAPHVLRIQGGGGDPGGYFGQRFPAGSGRGLGRGDRGGARARAQLDAGAAVRAHAAQSRARGAHRARPGSWRTAPARRRTARIWKPPFAKGWPRCRPAWCRAFS